MTTILASAWVWAGTMSRAETGRSDAHVQFKKAVAARAIGDFDAAIPLLRALLRADPGNPKVREELAYVLLLDKQFTSAHYHFQILAERAPNPKNRQLYQAVLQRLARERPFGVDVILQFRPSSNINGGSDASEVDTVFGSLPISASSQAEAGATTTFGVSGYFRTVVGAQDQIQLLWGVQHTDVSSKYVEDTDKIELALRWERVTNWGDFALSYGGSLEQSKSESLTRKTIAAELGFLTNARGRLDFAASYVDKTYDAAKGRSGYDITGQVRHTWFLPSGNSVWAGVILERARPERDHQRYAGGIVQFGGRLGLFGGTLLDVTLSIGQRSFDGVFPGTTNARFDRFEQLNISAQDSRLIWQGFTPRASCLARANHSNVAFYDATTYECGLDFTRKF